jgi:PadR family transcriptional regulator AphA
MNAILIEHNGKKIVECLPDGGLLDSDSSALELVAACGEHQTHRLLLPAGSLSPDFFHLRSGVAGAVLLKFSNYRIHAAAVIDPQQVGEGKFKDWVLETNRGRDFRVFFERQAAADWLAKD